MTELVLSQTVNELVLEDAGAVLELVQQNFELFVGAEQGPPGPPGSSGSSMSLATFSSLLTDHTHIHTQASPSASWVINHNLGFKPDVTLLSVGGVEIEGTVTHTSINQTVASFSTLVAGSARCL